MYLLHMTRAHGILVITRNLWPTLLNILHFTLDDSLMKIWKVMLCFHDTIETDRGFRAVQCEKKMVIIDNGLGIVY